MHFFFIIMWSMALHTHGDTRTVFVSHGEHGEVVFSDIATADTQGIQLDVSTINAQDVAEIQQQTQEFIALAQSLEAARLARQQQRHSQAFQRSSRQINSKQIADVPYSHQNRRFIHSPFHQAYVPANKVPPPAVEPQQPRRPFAPAFKPVNPALIR